MRDMPVTVFIQHKTLLLRFTRLKHKKVITFIRFQQTAEYNKTLNDIKLFATYTSGLKVLK